MIFPSARAVVAEATHLPRSTDVFAPGLVGLYFPINRFLRTEQGLVFAALAAVTQSEGYVGEGGVDPFPIRSLGEGGGLDNSFKYRANRLPCFASPHSVEQLLIGLFLYFRPQVESRRQVLA